MNGFGMTAAVVVLVWVVVCGMTGRRRKDDPGAPAKPIRRPETKE